ncbi:MAG: hypothetical protein Q9209_004594 [Squamulea sp. 1 TL-2023]
MASTQYSGALSKSSHPNFTPIQITPNLQRYFTANYPIPTSDSSEDELPDLDKLIKKLLPKPATSKFPKATVVENNGGLPPSPPATPAKFPPSGSGDSSTAPRTPTRGIRPTRGILPTPLKTPPQSHKRVRFHDDSESEAPTPVKRHCFNIPAASEPQLSSSIRSPNRVRISVFEAERVSQSIMKQVDWAKVADYVATNGRARSYKRAVQGVFDNWKDKLIENVDSDE